jgi:hypothetical protein
VVVTGLLLAQEKASFWIFRAYETISTALWTQLNAGPLATAAACRFCREAMEYGTEREKRWHVVDDAWSGRLNVGGQAKDEYGSSCLNPPIHPKPTHLSFFQPTQLHFVVRSCQNHGRPIPPGVPPPSAAALQATGLSPTTRK